MSEMPLHLMAHPEDVVVARLGPGEQPRWEWQRGPFASLTVTADETSIVTLADAVPAEVATEGPFRVVEVAGPLSRVGAMSRTLEPPTRTTKEASTMFIARAKNLTSCWKVLAQH